MTTTLADRPVGVWMSATYRGASFHALSPTSSRTVCDLSTRAGTVIGPHIAAKHGGVPCPVCFPEPFESRIRVGVEPSESPDPHATNGETR